MKENFKTVGAHAPVAPQVRPPGHYEKNITPTKHTKNK